MLTPETFARVIAARGEAARPVQNGEYTLYYYGHEWKFVESTNESYHAAHYNVYPADAHNACALHWLGMEAAIKWDTTAYFTDGKVDIEALAAAVIEHKPKEAP